MKGDTEGVEVVEVGELGLSFRTSPICPFERVPFGILSVPPFVISSEVEKSIPSLGAPISNYFAEHQLFSA